MEELVSHTEFGPVNGRDFDYVWEGDYLEACLCSDVGKKREKNEDSCIFTVPEDPEALRDRGLLFAVADGMGGASAGEYASRMALNILSSAYYKSPALPLPALLRSAIEAANSRVFEEAEINPSLHGMGTTVSAVVLHGDSAYVAQVGDSRVYLLRERAGIHQLTKDHSLVAEQVRNGLITEEEARKHQLRNLITRAVGIKEQVKVDLFALKLRPNDTLLVCSDGLCNMVTDEEISHTLAIGELHANTKKLIDEANKAGGTDNITALSLRITTTPPKCPVQEGADAVHLNNGGLWGKLRKLFA